MIGQGGEGKKVGVDKFLNNIMGQDQADMEYVHSGQQKEGAKSVFWDVS